jgi:hypothetical protein
MDTAIQLTASMLTLVGVWCYGNKSKLGPILGLASQVPWNIIMIHGGLWGLIPVNTAMLVIHIRNLWKWRNDGLAA